MRLTAVNMFWSRSEIKVIWGCQSHQSNSGGNDLTEVSVVGTSVPQERDKDCPGIFAVGGQVFTLR